MFHLFHRNSLCEKTRTKWRQGGSGTRSVGRSTHITHTHTRLAGVSRARSRAQRTRSVCSRVSLHSREGRAHQWATATGCPRSAKSWRLVARKTRSKHCYVSTKVSVVAQNSPPQGGVPNRHVCRGHPPPDSVSALGPIDVYIMVLMFTDGDYLTVFFFLCLLP